MARWTRISAIALLLLVWAQSAHANKIVSARPDTAIARPNVTFVKDFTFFRSDFELPLKWSVQAVGVAPVGKFELSDTYVGSFQFTPSLSDSGKLFSFKISVSDNRERQVSSDFSVLVGNDAPVVIQVEQTHNSFGGFNEVISISKSSGALTATSFKLTICYNGAGLTFDTLELSPKLVELGWMFGLSSARTLRVGQLGLQAASLHIFASAPTGNLVALPDGELLNLKFHISNDHALECQFLPINFVWSDCSDNVFTSANADTVFTCLQVTEPGSLGDQTVLPDENCSERNPVSFGGPCPGPCRSNKGMIDVPSIVFKNGGVDLVCGGLDFEPPGDLNLNGIAYEIADFELLSRWLAYGDSVLDINSTYRLAQVATSDANQDGETGSVADMVYLVRVIVGDALPFPKLRPYQGIALCEIRNDTLFVESNDSVPGVLLLFKADEKAKFENLSGIQMLVGRRGALTSLLFKPSLDNLLGHISPGIRPLVRINGPAELQKVEISDYNGNIMNVRK